MKASELINQIDNRINSGEFKQFPSTANRLMNIRGKLLHNKRLSLNDVKTLELNDFYLNFYKF